MKVLDPEFDLSEGLLADKDGSVLREVKTALGEASAEIRKQQDQGVPPDEFSSLQKLRDACDVAGTAVEKIWKDVHEAQ